MASAALGYATNKLAGEDALAGAALAQWGSKWKMYFPVGTAAFNLLQQDDIFLDKIHMLSKNVAVGERINVYTSTDTERKAKIAFDHVKLALHITRIDDYTVRVVGLAKDVYNFENMKYGDSLTTMKFDRDFFLIYCQGQKKI